MSSSCIKVILSCVLASVIFVVTYFLLRAGATVNKSDSYDLPSNDSNLKFILGWTDPDVGILFYLRTGQKGFIDRKCALTNCYVTSNRNLLSDVTKYDVILFHGPDLVSVPILNKDFPKIRSPHQKYVFASMESPHYYPVCSNRLDGIFNWTWSYRLDSDARLGYMLIKDVNGTVIGPNVEMNWMKLEDMKPVNKSFEMEIRTKKKAAAWFVSNCEDKSGRFKFGQELKVVLEKKHNLDLDIYGKCGDKICSRGSKENECDEMIKNTYYFYLAFENSISEDYVTEKLLRALKYDAIPVVYGGANYTRFMPDGIYLNARELGVELLAKKMKELIDRPSDYIAFFKWKNHYSYHSREETPEQNDYCHFCEMVNDEKKMEEVTVIDKFKEWWNVPMRC